MQETATLKRLLRTKELPTLPDVVCRILEITGDPNSCLNSLTGVIERDPALTANLLKLVNSAYYGNSQRVQSVRDAALLLGYDTVRALALGTSIISTFRAARGFDARHFWSHSLACALSAGVLSREATGVSSDMAFLGGLLHDLGTLLFALCFPADTDSVHREAAPAGQLAREVEVFGMTHPQAGAHLARHWRLDPALCDGIAGHHLEDGRPLVETSPLARLIYLAGGVCGTAYAMDEVPQSHGLDEVAASLGLSEGTLGRLRPRLQETLETVPTFLAESVR